MHDLISKPLYSYNLYTKNIVQMRILVYIYNLYRYKLF